jgi:molecular chaperone DnaJ
MTADLYILLGLERGATTIEIKRAYKRLARRYHPDINPGDRVAAAHFRQIADAYETLSDPDRRRLYDATGSTESSTVTTTFGFEGFDFSVSASGADASTFGDLFADVFRPRDPGDAGAERGVDLHQSITVGFDAAVRGGEHVVTVTRQAPCRGCRGRGSIRLRSAAAIAVSTLRRAASRDAHRNADPARAGRSGRRGADSHSGQGPRRPQRR